MAPNRLFRILVFGVFVVVVALAVPNMAQGAKKILFIAPSNDIARKEHARFKRMLDANTQHFVVEAIHVQGKDYKPTLVFDPKLFDVVIIAWNQQFGRSDLSTYAQEQIINATRYFGTGLILNEWVGYDSTQGYFHKFKEANHILLKREGGSFKKQSISIGDTSHVGVQKIVLGALLGGQVEIPRGGISVGTKIPEATTAVIGTNMRDTCAIREIQNAQYPAYNKTGRIVHFAYCGTYFGFDPYSSSTLQKLWMNAIGWASHDTDDQVKVYNIDPTATIDDGTDPSGMPPSETKPPTEIRLPGVAGSDDPNLCNQTCSAIPPLSISTGICKHVTLKQSCPKVWLIDGVYYNTTFYQMSLAAKAQFESQMKKVPADSKAACDQPLKDYVCSEIFRKCVPKEKYLYKICRGTCWEMRRTCRIEAACDDPKEFYDNKIGEELGKTLWGPPDQCTGFIKSASWSVKPSTMAIIGAVLAVLLF